MKRRALLSLPLALGATASTAGIIDWFNGVSVGMTVPEHDLLYLPGPPDAGAKLLLLDFWATWCAPCRESIPKLNAFHRDFSKAGLSVVGVTDEPIEAVQRFAKTVSMEYTIGIQQQVQLFKLLGIKARPYALIAGRNAKVRWRGQPSELDASLIRSLLAGESG